MSRLVLGLGLLLAIGARAQDADKDKVSKLPRPCVMTRRLQNNPT